MLYDWTKIRQGNKENENIMNHIKQDFLIFEM